MYEINGIITYKNHSYWKKRSWCILSLNIIYFDYYCSFFLRTLLLILSSDKISLSLHTLLSSLPFFYDKFFFLFYFIVFLRIYIFFCRLFNFFVFLLWCLYTNKAIIKPKQTTPSIVPINPPTLIEQHSSPLELDPGFITI